MHTLMLHGHSTSAFIFKAQTGPLRSKLDRSFSFDFIDAPHPCPPPPGLKMVLSEAYRWIDAPSAESMKSTIKWLQLYMDKNGPYDCICCFSKASAVIASVLLYHTRGFGEGSQKPLPFKSVVFFNGSIEYSVFDDEGMPQSWVTQEARDIKDQTEEMVRGKVGAISNLASTFMKGTGLWDDTSQLLHDPHTLPPRSDCFGLDFTALPPELTITIPTVHIYGGKDPIWPSSIQLAYLCDPTDRVMYDHQGGHDVPRSAEVVADIADIFRKLAKDTCSKTMSQRPAHTYQKTVLITGCTPGGIGHALCVEFHRRGLRVIGTARNPAVMEDLAKRGIDTVQLDVTSQDSIVACHRTVAHITGGRLDILVNNAGRTHTHPALDLSIPDVRLTFETNVFGVMAMVAEFSDQLVAAKGLIINIASLAAVAPYVFGSAYCASKGAVVSYSRTLRQELRPLGVRVMVCMAGTVKSNIASANHRMLPESSVYLPIRDIFEKRLVFSQNNATVSTESFAAALADSSMRGEVWWFLRNWTGRPDWFWFGGMASLLWWALLLFGEWAVDYFCWMLFELDKLRKIVDLDEAVKKAMANETKAYSTFIQAMGQTSEFEDFKAQAASMATVMGDSSPSRLPHPVVIPQRRPKKRDRGFVRAYAPDLMRCGIDQATFLAFVDGFNQAVASHPVVGAINLAGAAAGAVPSSVFIGAPIIGLAVQVAAGAYTEVQARKGCVIFPSAGSSHLNPMDAQANDGCLLCSQNAYITKMNKELFGPHGLYCCVMAYDINSRNNTVQRGLDVDPGVPGPDIDPSGGSKSKLRSNDGVIGASQFPIAAHLVYPDPADASPSDDEDWVDSDGGNGSRGGGTGSGFMYKLGKAAASLNSRKDLKSQVKFVYPHAELTDKDLRKQDKREAKQERKDEKRERKAEKKQQKHPDRQPKARKIKQLLPHPEKFVEQCSILMSPESVYYEERWANAFLHHDDMKDSPKPSVKLSYSLQYLPTAVIQRPILSLLGLVFLVVLGSSVKRQLEVRAFKRAHNCKSPPHLPQREYFLGLDAWRVLSRERKEHRVLEGAVRRSHELGRTNSIVFMGQRYIVTSDEENIKAAYSTQSAEFGIECRLSYMKKLLGEGIFTLEGTPWQHSRAMIRPAFTKAQLSELISIEKHVQALINCIPKVDGATVDLQPLLFNMAIDNGTDFLLGTSINCQSSAPGSPAWQFSESWDYAADAMQRVSELGMWGSLFRDKKYDESIRIVHSFTDSLVSETLRNGPKPGRYNLLGELVKECRDPLRLRGESLCVLLAARDTTSTFLSTTFFYLARNKAVWNKLAAEVDALGGQTPDYETLKGMKYLKAVLNESLRLVPPVPRNIRIARRDATLPRGGGPDGESPSFVPKGTTIVFPIYATHRYPGIWGSDSEVFRPERWLEEKFRPGWAFVGSGSFHTTTYNGGTYWHA
ncbi:NADPH-dependent 1-acyldihydroxyacetone phosphate reductase [Seiridium cupressi]